MNNVVSYYEKKIELLKKSGKCKDLSEVIPDIPSTITGGLYFDHVIDGSFVDYLAKIEAK